MKALFFSILLSTLFAQIASAQNYAVKDIPDSLKSGADAIIRNWETKFEINDVESAIYTVRKVITILNEDGRGFGDFVTLYDKLNKIRKIRVAVYDANGKVIERVKGSDINDRNYTDAGSVYDDYRVKYYFPEELDFPYTVETEFEIVKKSSISYPSWNPQRSSRLAVEQASLEVTVPKEIELRFMEFNYENPEGNNAQKIDQGETEFYQWELKNLKAMKREARGVSVGDLSPKVLIAPTRFSMEGYEGTMDTWKNFGLWVKKLNTGRDKLTPEVENEVKALVAGVDDPREKVKKVYQYMQSNTRYVSIQLGIGGFQTFEAADVCVNGYGDCKALTNYTYSLLKSVGVKSYYTLVMAGDEEDDIITDFPSSQFNHVILSVPMEQDTVWLECTSQKSPFNFLGGFTSDRHVLMITEEGGRLVKTPTYTEEMNTQVSNVSLVLDEEGNATAGVKTVYRGRQYDDYFGINDQGKEEQRKFLLNKVDIPAFDLVSFSFNEEKSEDPFLEENIDLNLRRYASISGKRLFFNPNIMNRYTYIPPRNENRQSAIISRYAYTDVDSIAIKIPESFRLEFTPEPVSFESEFGKYEVSYDFDPDKNELLYVRHIQIYKGRFSPESYNEYRNFRKRIVKADKAKLIIIGNT